MKTVYKSLRLGVVSAALALAVTGFALAKDVKPEERCHCVVPAGSTGADFIVKRGCAGLAS